MARPSSSYRGARRNAARKAGHLRLWTNGPHFNINRGTRDVEFEIVFRNPITLLRETKRETRKVKRVQVVHNSYVKAMEGKPV